MLKISNGEWGRVVVLVVRVVLAVRLMLVLVVMRCRLWCWWCWWVEQECWWGRSEYRAEEEAGRSWDSRCRRAGGGRGGSRAVRRWGRKMRRLRNGAVEVEVGQAGDIGDAGRETRRDGAVEVEPGGRGTC